MNNTIPIIFNRTTDTGLITSKCVDWCRDQVPDTCYNIHPYTLIGALLLLISSRLNDLRDGNNNVYVEWFIIILEYLGLFGGFFLLFWGLYI